jgi:MSHA biogenesis protein MshO
MRNPCTYDTTHNRKARPAQRQLGFTMIELIMVIVIMGAIGGMVSVFMKSPIDAYFDSARRAALTDVADTVARRMARDIQRALPNSIRTSGTNCLEFIPTKSGWRYRTSGTGSLDFTAAISSFNMLASKTDFAGVTDGIPTEQRIAQDDLIVIYNLGIPGSDAYRSENWSKVTSVGTTAASETPINIDAFKFPLESGTGRFQVIPSTEKLVSYVCSPAASTNASLYRTVSGDATTNPYSTTAGCPVSTSGAVVASVLATNVDCTGTTFNYSGSDLARNAIVSMVLKVTDSSSGESVSLQHDVHVSNTP